MENQDNFTQTVGALVRQLWDKSDEGKYVAVAQTPEEIKKSLLHSTTIDSTGRARQFMEEMAQELNIGMKSENLTFATGIGDTYSHVIYVPRNPELYK